MVRLLNVGLRITTLGARFVFIFFLAKYLSPAEVGYYGLFTATVGYAMYFAGLDFYTFATREIIKTPQQERGQLIRGQAALSGLLYLPLIPVALILLNHADWPINLIWWFVPLLILEHFNQEIFRLLVALSEQVTASIILFARQGSWAIGSVLLMAIEPGTRNLDIVMLSWLLGGLIAAGLGLWKLKHLRMGGWRKPVDWTWVKKGIKVSAWFLIASLALRGVQTVDRYWLDALGGIQMVASYVLLLGVASTLMVFLDAGVFSFTYPLLISNFQKDERGEVHTKMKIMLAQTIGFCVVFSIVSMLLLPVLLGWINKPTYQNAIGLYPWLLMAMVINAISMVPHYGLYAGKADNVIVHSHIAALVTFVAITWSLSAPLGAMAVPAGLNAAFLIILIWKTAGYLRLFGLKKPN